MSSDPWFKVSTGDGFYHHHLSWQDDPTVPFAALPRYVQQLKAGVTLDRPTERLQREREELAQAYRQLLPSEDEQAAFDQMLGLCRTVFPYVEDHKLFCEHWFSTTFFDKIRGFGGLLHQFDIVEQAEDIFHLHHTEADQALAEVQLVWASGGTALGGRRFKPLVAERKRMLELVKQWPPPPALGPVPPGFSDPALQMLWGISFETVKQWSSSIELDANEIRGYAASPGIVEGHARVLLSVNDIGMVAGRRHPRLPRHCPELGTGVRQDPGGRLRYRGDDVPCRDRGARVWHAGRRRDRLGHQAHPHRRPASRRW